MKTSPNCWYKQFITRTWKKINTMESPTTVVKSDYCRHKRLANNEGDIGKVSLLLFGKTKHKSSVLCSKGNEDEKAKMSTWTSYHFIYNSVITSQRFKGKQNTYVFRNQFSWQKRTIEIKAHTHIHNTYVKSDNHQRLNSLNKLNRVMGSQI